jgi:phage FluMu protein Com
MSYISQDDNVACDDSHATIENDVLVKMVSALSLDLKKAYGGKAKLDFILGSQQCSHNHEGLGYVPKKGNNAFAKHKSTFVKECDKVCQKCHKNGHIKKDCPKYKNVSFAHFDNFYVITHNSRGVHAKKFGTPIVGAKKNVIWVPKSFVTNIQGPN